MGGVTYQLSGNPSSESQLGRQTYFCDWTANGPAISGGYMAVRFDRYGSVVVSET